MKLLSDLLYKAGIVEIKGTTHLAVSDIYFDSRKVTHSSLFIATRGTQVDGHHFIHMAIEKGADGIVCEDFPEELNPKVTYVKVKDSQAALGIIAANFYDNPSEKLKLVGVTGTNGKTTSVQLLFKLFRSLGKKAGMLSTVNNQINGEVLPSTHTTPDAIQINALFRQMVDAGCKYAFMEVSSHAIHQRRIAGLDFDVAVFTNITHDHLDYHKTFDEYIQAKKLFFDGLGDDAIALTNQDERHGGTMVLNTKAKVKTYSLKSMSDFKAKIIENTITGLQLNIDGQEVWTRLAGDFNAYNLLVTYAVGVLLGEDKMNVLMSVSALGPVEGRFEHFKSDSGIIGVIDYAHTPDALKKILDTLNNVKVAGKKLYTVVGCGGNRDKEKRPVMAKIASTLSDQAILTSDNPRNEEPEAILNDMRIGLDPTHAKNTLSITDRREAIKVACSFANPGDIVLVAGKGHEKYQEIKGIKHPFDDKETLKETFKILGK
jgi:UDP-N-acetylmuramoyl-L-alanyl-D-glutamate--2,6-diaminopimelate ligase